MNATSYFIVMSRYSWYQIIKQGFEQLYITAQALGVLEKVIALRAQNPQGVYFKCCSIVYRMQQRQSTLRLNEAWFRNVDNIARDHDLLAYWENRYFKSAIITNKEGQRIGRVWAGRYGICWDLRNWTTRYEAAETIKSAIAKIKLHSCVA